jgi:hypothetical protein
VKENQRYENRIREPEGQASAENIHANEAPETVHESINEKPRKQKQKQKPNKIRKALQEFLGGDYLSKETVAGNIGYILFLGFLAMVYIGNTYYTEKMYKSIDRTNRELKELRYQYITTKSMLMFQGRQSEISKRAIGFGLKESKTPPYKIQYSGESLRSTEKSK